MKGFPIQFNIYAENAGEAQEAQQAFISFINFHAQHGRAVTAKKLTAALNNWQSNPLVRSRIINYFKS